MERRIGSPREVVPENLGLAACCQKESLVLGSGDWAELALTPE